SEFAAVTGRRHAVGVASGTDALRLALFALGVGAGDEVIVPAFTAVPTAAAVCATGAVPVFADVDARTATIDPVSAAAAVTERTRAVIPVHLYGRPAPIPRLGVPVLEDAAQAHGAVGAEPAMAGARCQARVPPLRGTSRRSRRLPSPRPVRNGGSLPACPHPTACLRALRTRTVSRSRGVGGGVRLAAVFPGDDRRRD